MLFSDNNHLINVDHKIIILSSVRERAKLCNEPGGCFFTFPVPRAISFQICVFSIDFPGFRMWQLRTSSADDV